MKALKQVIAPWLILSFQALLVHQPGVFGGLKPAGKDKVDLLDVFRASLFWFLPSAYSAERREVFGRALSRQNIAHEKTMPKAGVKYFRFHTLRHHGASVLERANVPIGSIQRILGHENRTTTEIYLHSIGESEREAMAVFEKASQISLSAESLTQ